MVVSSTTTFVSSLIDFLTQHMVVLSLPILSIYFMQQKEKSTLFSVEITNFVDP